MSFIAGISQKKDSDQKNSLFDNESNMENEEQYNSFNQNLNRNFNKVSEIKLIFQPVFLGKVDF